jgi:hypothetical protein
MAGLAFDTELVLLEEAAARVSQGWWMVGPDPDDEIAFNIWLREVNAQFSVDYDPGDEHD